MCRLASVLLLILTTGTAWADRGVLSGDLGVWLKQTAAPQLADTLANHPRFKGERIRFSAIRDGMESPVSNELIEAIRQQLTHFVLRKGHNDVSTGVDAGACAAVNTPVQYVVGIDVQPQSRSRWRIGLAILNVPEAIWVSGVSLNWQGRLLSSERAALNVPVHHGAPGTRTNPIFLADHQALAQALYAQMTCHLGHGLEGTLHIPHHSDPELQLALGELKGHLALSPIRTTRNAGDALWQLRVELHKITGRIGRLTLSLQATDAPRQQIAALYVRDERSHPGAPATPQRTSLESQSSLAQQISAPALLSPLRLQDGKARCRSGGACAEVAFDLTDSAYLLIFRTHNAQLTPAACHSTTRRRNAGQQIYRVALSTDDQHVGLYVLASRDEQVIRELTSHLRSAPGACGQPGDLNDRRWLTTTLRAITRLSDDLTWRTLHLRNGRQGTETL